MKRRIYTADIRHLLTVGCVFAVACGPEVPQAHPDAGVDGGDQGLTQDTGFDPDAPPRDPLSEVVWQTLQELSPADGLEPPRDSTNRWAEDARARRLGQFLFFEEAISGDGSVSCASCHHVDHDFAGKTSLPIEGITGEVGGPKRHTPTLVNSAYSDWFFWDGRVDTLWGQAVGPFESAIEMGGTRVQLAHYVYGSSTVREAYESIFGPLPELSSLAPLPPRGRPIEQPASEQERADAAAWEGIPSREQELVNEILVNAMKSIAAYEMQLIATDSPFDRFAAQVREAPGDPRHWDAITPQAQEGFRIFVEIGGCLECHSGPMLSDFKFHNLGVPGDESTALYDEGRAGGLEQARLSPFRSSGPYSDDPEGSRALFLGAVPGQTQDLGAFRTPSLRNVSKRPPYMHAGQLEDLRAVMEFYSEPPDGFPKIGRRSSEVARLKLNDTQIAALVAFMESLSSDGLSADLMERPPSPLLEQ